ncbi:hypothetical protein KEH57_04295 [Burkholderia cenocepacia]|uniref:hypothetical protein n=1 Tax=Burkholderia cenocepacia TaxID=95486 RepID=UPI001BACC7CE|nr:hypothetical protein [Burkholderia cenocepacia]QUO26156.1 hypothetical protein KEH57_04295 [Burkholderia cenocepacia]
MFDPACASGTTGRRAGSWSVAARAAAATLSTFATMFSTILTNFRCGHPNSIWHRIGDLAYWKTDGCMCCAHLRLLFAGIVIGAALAACVG